MRKTARQVEAEPLLEAYWWWVNTLEPTPGSKLAEAVTYAKNQKEYLNSFLEHGEVDISNNYAGNAIRPFTVGRKNWLFCDTPKGADASAIVYTVVETAKANGLEPYRYLKLLLTELPYLGKTPSQEVGCWAHARRKFDEALQTLPKEMQKDAPAAIGECYCSRLFKLEQALAELTPEERYEKRLEQEKPVLDALLSWANEMQAKTAPKSALGRAIHYLLEQWPYLTRYLEDGRLELSNNRAERSIKPFVMGRKNWLFANTPGGAQASAVIYSLIETAKENDLDPYRYLLWILQNAPQLSEEDAVWAEKLLPANAPEECCMPQK